MISIALDVAGAVAYLKSQVPEVRYIEDIVTDLKAVNLEEVKHNPLLAVMTVVNLVPKVAELAQVMKALEVEENRAIETAAQFVDRLVGFSGTLWKFVPVGSVLEAVDYPLAKGFLELGYRYAKLRAGGTKEQFTAAVKAKYGIA